MAFRRRFTRYRGRFASRGGSSKTVPRWTAVTADTGVLAAGSTTAITLVNPEAILPAGALALLEQELSVIRLVGHVTTRLSAVTEVAGASVGIGILRTESTTVTSGGFQDPLIQQQLAQRDWLRVMNCDVPAGGGTNGFLQRQEIDIRVGRKLKSNQLIILAVSNLANGDDVIVTIDIRILIVIKA